MTTEGSGRARRVVQRHPGFTLVGLPCVILAVIAGLLWSPGQSRPRAAAGPSPTGVAPVAQNRPAPDFDLPRLSGSGRLSLHTLRGHVVVMNFWASWCTACRHEAPALRELSRRYRGTDVEFLGVDHGDRPSSALAFERRNRLRYPSVVDDADTLLGKYGVVGLPITYVIGRDGRIRYQSIGMVDPEALQHAIDRVRVGQP